jgi:hypothetical protein
MEQEGFCPTHGPYDARLSGCPYCQSKSGGTQSGGDETRVFGSSGQTRGDVDDLPTDIGWMRGGKPPGSVSEEETQVYPRRQPTGTSAGAGRADPIDETVVEGRTKGMLGWLIVKRGARRGHVFEIRSDSTIGRKGTHIVLNDQKVTELHAKIGVRGEQFVIADVLSKNGTHVNGTRIQAECLLNENDEVRIGDTVMVLKVLPAEQE